MKNTIRILTAFFLLLNTPPVYCQQWQNVTPNGSGGAYSWSFLSEEQGWICCRDSTPGNFFRIMHTSNACMDWDTCYMFNSGIRFNRLQMIDSLNGYGAGGYGCPIFWRTSDGGHTWQDITDWVLMQNGGPLDQSDAFFFVNADTGFYGGLNSMFKTVDGGLFWSQIDIPADANPSTPEIDSYRINQIYFSGSDHGWAIGNSVYSCVLKTIDGGVTWQLADSWIDYSSSLHFCDSMHGGYLVNTSWSHHIVFTSDNFNSKYFKSFSSLPTSLSGLYFQNDSTVWIGGVYDGVILRSRDGGINFDTINPDGFAGTFWFINGFNFWGNSGYAFGSHVLKYIDTLNTAVHQAPVAISNLFLYPNPAVDKVSIDFIIDQPEQIVIELYSPEGRCVYSKTEIPGKGSGTVSFPVKNLSAGVYILKVRSNHLNIARKLIVKR